MPDVINAVVLVTNFLVVPATVYGCQLALGALGVTLVYGVLRFSNFAHGEIMAFGAMITILGTWLLQSWEVGLGPLPTALLAMPLGMALAGGLCLLSDRWIYRFYRRRRAPSVIFLVASVGVMFVLNGLIRFVIGPDDQVFTDGARFLISAREFKAATGLAEGLAIKTTQTITVAVTVLLVLWLFWFLGRTRTGKSMRAYSDNEDLALLSGINPERVVAVTWLIVGALAAVAGTLYGLDKSFKPFTFLSLLLPIFAAAIVGGLGSPLGAIAGAFVVAFSEVLLTYPYKKFLSYLGPEGWRPEGLVQLLATDYKFAVSFFILVVVLLVRPTGIFSGKST